MKGYIELSSGVPVFVDICIAKGNVSGVLLHGGFCEASERLEIAKGLKIIIVGIP